MTVYYNEIDKNAAAWLRNLIAAGHIAPGIVDERSIEDVVPTELMGFTQCHFFAGIGVWSHALRNAGWPDTRPAWTGSCPCQPFSAAGKGAGFIDERHLWPAFQHLISQCKPEFVFGEQVASKDADPWIDLVHTDLEALGYAFGAVAFPSAGVGAPHIRDRTYWVADAKMPKHKWHRPVAGGQQIGLTDISTTIGLADARQHHRGPQAEPAHHQQPQAIGPADWAGGCGVSPGGLADTNSRGCSAGHGIRLHGAEHDAEHGGGKGAERPGPVNGFWRAADWLGCRDDKWRPVEPGTFPLDHGVAGRVGRLRAYGNSLTAPAASAFISSFIESIGG